MKTFIVAILLLLLCAQGMSQSTRIKDQFKERVNSIKVAISSGDTEEPLRLSKKGMAWARNVKQDSMYASFCYITGHCYINKYVIDSAMIYLLEAISVSKANSYPIVQVQSQMDIIDLYQKIDIDLGKSQEWINHTKALMQKLSDEDSQQSFIFSKWERHLGRQKALLYDIDSATYYYLRAIRLAKEDNDVESQAAYLANLGNLLTDVGRFGDGIIYYRQAEQLFKKIAMISNNDVIFYNIGNAYINMDNYDSALFYIEKAIVIARTYDNPMILARSNISLAQIQLVKESYSKENAKAVENGLLESVRLAKKYHLKDVEANAYLFLGRSSSKINNYKSAALYLNSALNLALEMREKFTALNASTYLAELYEQTNEYENAYKYRTLEALYKDSVYQDDILQVTSELEGRFQSETKQAEIEKLNAENKYIVVEHEKQQLLYAGVGTFLILALLITVWLFYYRNKQRLYKKELELRDLRYQIVQTRQTALRAQMNPHFIFNCMTAVDYYILNNEKESASELLTYFADLIRVVLEHSEREMVTLQEELDSLELYLKVEQLRFSNLFDYTIYSDKSIKFAVPPLLLQPYVENAINHGISLLQDVKGKIEIEVLTLAEDEISITIRDNGIGLAKSLAINAQSRPQHHSLGTRITQERIDLLRILYSYDIKVSIVDLSEVSDENQGTAVSLILSRATLGSKVMQVY